MEIVHLIITLILTKIVIVGFSLNLYYFYIILQTYRLEIAKSKTPDENSYDYAKRKRFDTRVHLPQSFALSFVSVFTIRLTVSLVYDIPSMFNNSLLGGSSTAVLFGWLGKCAQYALLLHLMLLTCHKYTLFYRHTSQYNIGGGKKPFFSSRSMLQFVTYLLWFPAIIFSLVVKSSLCESRFTLNKYCYDCGEVVSKMPGAAESSTFKDFKINEENTFVVKIIDQSMASVTGLVLLVALSRMVHQFKLLTFRHVDVGPMLVLTSTVGSDTNLSVRNIRKVHVNQERLHVRQMTWLCCLFFIELVFWTGSLWVAENVYLHLTFYVVRLFTSAFMPLAYVRHSKYNVALGCLRRRQENLLVDGEIKTGVAANGMKIDQAHFSSASAGTISLCGGSMTSHTSPFSNLATTSAPSSPSNLNFRTPPVIRAKMPREISELNVEELQQRQKSYHIVKRERVASKKRSVHGIQQQTSAEHDRTQKNMKNFAPKRSPVPSRVLASSTATLLDVTTNRTPRSGLVNNIAMNHYYYQSEVQTLTLDM